MRTATSIVALALATACSSPAAHLRSVLPDDRMLIDEQPFDAGSLARGAGEPSDYFQITHDTVHDTNATIGGVLDLVGAITAFPPTWSDADATALWGPWDGDDGNLGQLWVTEADDGSLDWAIELRPEDSAADAWTGVLQGHIDAGATADASIGWWQMDLTAIEAAGSGDGTTGTVATHYDLDATGAKVDVGFGDIAADGSVPADGSYHYEVHRGDGGLMDLQVNGDISDPPNGTPELLLIRSRWQHDGQGRADAHVTQGDLGPLTYTESDCWDQSHTTVFFENNFELVSDGEESRCAFGAASYSE